MQSTSVVSSPTQWLDLKDLQRTRKRGRTSIYRDIADGVLPEPVRIAPNSARWPSDEIAAIDRARRAGADDDEIRDLVRALVAARKEPAR